MTLFHLEMIKFVNTPRKEWGLVIPSLLMDRMLTNSVLYRSCADDHSY